MLNIPFIHILFLSLSVAASAFHGRQTITSLTSSQIEAFKPYSFFTAAAYCPPSTTINWSCGSNCDANAGFMPITSGGDGSDVQFWYVGYDPDLDTIVVGHQGTDESSLEADLTDLDISLESLDTTLFPGLPSSIKVHNGFSKEQAMTAPLILQAVLEGISIYNTASISLVGHSLGAALALLDAVYLPLHLTGDNSFQTIVYGLPRVGNQAFANYVDANVRSLTHINNMKDPIPILPPEFLGFVHPSGEIHIMADSSWVSCPGQDNPSSECIVGDVSNIFDADVSNHDGPYDGVSFSSDGLPCN